MTELRIDMPCHLFQSLGHITFMNRMSMETDISTYWIFISFQCYGSYQKTWVSSKTDLHRTTPVQRKSDWMQKYLVPGFIGMVEQFGQLSLKISCHVTLSCEDMLRTKAIKPAFQIDLRWGKESPQPFKLFRRKSSKMYCEKANDRLNAIIGEMKEILKFYISGGNFNFWGLDCNENIITFCFYCLLKFLKLC